MHTSYLCHTLPKTFLFTPLAVHARHYGCITIMDLDRRTPVGCCCSLQTCTVISSISFTRMNQESLYEISLLCQGKTKLLCHTSIQSRHLICKFWCQNFCVCLWGPEGCVHREVDGVWTCCSWPTLKKFFIRGSWRKRTAGHLAPGYWVVWLQVWNLWLIIKTYLVLRAAVAQGLCFVTRCPNQIRYPVWGQEPALLRALIVECLLRKSGLLLCIWSRWSRSEVPYI
jgi:hypothetical protein